MSSLRSQSTVQMNIFYWIFSCCTAILSSWNTVIKYFSALQWDTRYPKICSVNDKRTILIFIIDVSKYNFWTTYCTIRRCSYTYTCEYCTPEEISCYFCCFRAAVWRMLCCNFILEVIAELHSTVWWLCAVDGSVKNVSSSVTVDVCCIFD